MSEPQKSGVSPLSTHFILTFFLSALLSVWALPLAVCAESGPILTGKVVTTVTRAANMPFAAVVDEVLVKPGDLVKKGTPLLRYHLQDVAERVLQREVTTGAGTENLKSQVLDLQQNLASTIAERNKSRQLVSSGLGSKQGLSRLEENVNSLRSKIALLESTIHKTEKNFAARLKELSDYYGEPIKEGETLPPTLTLTSPINGYVLTLASELNPGTLLGSGSAPIQVGQLNPVQIEIPVYEADVNELKVGDKAQIEIPSLNNRIFSGIVSEISWLSTDMSVANPSYYTVKLTVPNSDMLLKPGFKAIVRFNAPATKTAS